MVKQSVPFILGSVIAAAGVGYGVREHRQARDLALRQQALTQSINELQQQVKDLTRKPERPPAPARRQKPVAETATAPASPARPPARRAPRWKSVESRLEENEQQIARTRADLEGRLTSTKDELTGSIARTQEELVALQKRGQRDVREFTLAKSKSFQRVGPVSLSLRKADTKRKRYNLELLVDDVKLQKKDVNLFEPVYLTLSDRPQPVELVVTQIAKDEIRGYVSLPKYKKSELVAADAARTRLQ